MAKFTPDGKVGFILSTNASAVPARISLADLELSLEFEKFLKKNAKEFPVTLDLPPELLGWIGRVVTYWALAEWIQAGTLCVLMNIGRQEGRVILGVRLGNVIHKIKQLMEMKEINIPSNLDDLSARLTKCEQDRNLVGHGVWMIDPKSQELCVQNPSGEWKPEKQATISKRKYPEAFFPTVQWFEGTLENIEKAIRDLQGLDRHIDAALAALKGKSG